jgi:nucleoside-diphosphate-sugar epimerase
MHKSTKIIITGAAGCLGMNTVILLKERGYTNIVAIDKHRDNLAVLRELHPDISVVEADLAVRGDWERAFEGGGVLLQMHAQITSLYLEEHRRNHVTATSLVLDAAVRHGVSYVVHLSSSVVISVADDFYTVTKREQEELVSSCSIPHCSLRPTLMFGWFDRTHFGWLFSFMKKFPVFPIPGSGRFLRQPLYVRDMAAVVISAMERRPVNGHFNIIGREDIDYIDIIRAVKRVNRLRSLIVKLPFWFFKFLLDVYAFVFKSAPFTSQQLVALAAGDYFESDPWWDIFDVSATPFDVAINEAFTDERYSGIVLKL